MDFIATAEQKVIIEADLVAQQVIACAGSGKTATAVRRVLALRKQLGKSRGRVALLSFSNIAVDTFRAEYRQVASAVPGLSDRVYIATVDSFLSTNIILPHSARLMGCNRQPFLVHGHEPFLHGFKVFNGEHNVDIKNLQVRFNQKLKYYEKSGHAPAVELDEYVAKKAIGKLGLTGAFTHELGRYWAILTLARQKRLVQIIARRYPFILVDEAQDIGSTHGLILRALQSAGSTVSLVGDPNQSIFEFADADGSFLRDYVLPAGGLAQPLTENRRSVEPIVAMANNVAGTASIHVRPPPARVHGAFYVRYQKDKVQDLLSAFDSILVGNSYTTQEAVVLCRGNPMVDALRGGTDELGQGAAEHFANAAVNRDRGGDIAIAFQFALDGVLRILEKSPATLRGEVLAGTRGPLARYVRALVWAFLRDPATGIPSSALKGRLEWLPKLKQRLPALLDQIEQAGELVRRPTWSSNVTAAKLGTGPLWQQDLVGPAALGLKICTVHQVKGESIGAVIYVAKPKDITNLLLGPVNEEGRIGYVAVTRAKDLLILAVPFGVDATTLKMLEGKGFAPWQPPVP